MRKIKAILTFCWMISFLFFTNVSITYAVTPISDPQYQGIDVSDWQGYIDYERVRESGIQVVYIKASQGNNIKDPYFDINYENAKANGLKVGFYHFLTATNIRRSTRRSKIFCFCNSRKRARL